MKNIFTLLVLSAVCCTIFEIITLLKYNRDGLIALVDKCTDVNTYVQLLVFNVPIVSGHLWYLLAALYVYVLFYFVTKFHIKENVLFILAPFLVLLHLFLGEGLSMLGIVLPIYFVRNFALMGIPFFVLGLLVKKYEHKIRSIPLYMIFIFTVLGAFASIVSRGLWGGNELYTGSLLLLAAIVCTSLKYADAKFPSFLTALEGCSTYIYIFHIMIATVLCILYGVVGIDMYSSVVLENLHPIVVCVSSTIFACIFVRILKKAGRNNRLFKK